jgi:predicted MPP superfamily phosphohydrolase
VWVLLPLANMWKATIIAAGVVCFFMLFLDLSGTLDKLPLPLARVLYEIGTSSIIVLLYVVMAFLVLDAGRLIHLVPRSWLFQNGVTTTALCGLLFTLFLCAHIHYKNKVRVPLDLETSKPLSKEYTLVMASDLHLGYHNTRRDLARWIDLINAEKPDLVLFGGDIVDISTEPLEDMHFADEFYRLTAPAYTVMGNHEYIGGAEDSERFLASAGITVLKDSVAHFEGVDIIGRDDYSRRHRAPLQELVPSPGHFSLVLDHQPVHLEEAQEAGIDFQFSGHTHHGQAWPISWVTDAIFEKAWGPYEKGHTQYYISSGLGIWGPKIRIGSRSEYLVLHITPTK